METLYCTIDTKNIIVTGAAREQAAGGAAAVRYAVIPRRSQAQPRRRGKVLSLDAYRQAVEERECPRQEPEQAPAEGSSAERLGLGLELLTSAAVLGMTVVVAMKFFLL